MQKIPMAANFFLCSAEFFVFVSVHPNPQSAKQNKKNLLQKLVNRNFASMINLNFVLANHYPVVKLLSKYLYVFCNLNAWLLDCQD
jgi:hypothetical protein